MPDANAGRDAYNALSEHEWSRIWSYFNLSPREQQIAEMIVRGMSDSEVATSLGISPHTVHTHIERLYRKVNANSRAGLILRVFACYVSFCRQGASE
jgi:DNA-binding CsgD family transcriptional regulator